MQTEMTEVITSEDQLREIMGYPAERNVQKVIPMIDEHCRMFIEHSPFMLLASSDAGGKLDVSPKGDPPGFVHVLEANLLNVQTLNYKHLFKNNIFFVVKNTNFPISRAFKLI